MHGSFTRSWHPQHITTSCSQSFEVLRLAPLLALRAVFLGKMSSKDGWQISASNSSNHGKIQWENPDALRTAPSQRTQTKQNTTMIMIIMMLCSYSRFLCRITSQLYRPSHERLGRPMLGPLMTDWHSSVQSVQSQIRKHVLSIVFPLNVQTLPLKILCFLSQSKCLRSAPPSPGLMMRSQLIHALARIWQRHKGI